MERKISIFFFKSKVFFIYYLLLKVFFKGEVFIMKNMVMLLNCLYFILELRKGRGCSCFDFIRNLLLIIK